jgi:hypothetical protein
VSNNTLQWTADEPDPQRGYCGHLAKARVGNYTISPSVSFGLLLAIALAICRQGQSWRAAQSATTAVFREAKAAAQRDQKGYATSPGLGPVLSPRPHMTRSKFEATSATSDIPTMTFVRIS